MSAGRPLLKLKFELGILLGLQLDGLLLIGGNFRDLSHMLGLYRSRIAGFRSLYIRSFNIIGDQ